MHEATTTPGLYGLMAEFADPTSLVAAAGKTREQGYTRYDAYSPFPIHDLFEAMHLQDRRVPFIVLCAGILGALTGFGLASWVSAVAYPLNIGGRPFISWPMFIPVTFELTILFAALSAFGCVVVLNGLPMPYHPVFNVERFARRASQKGFFLVIESTDPKFDRIPTRVFLQSLGALEVNEVEE
jgi:hypothetical protein